MRCRRCGYRLSSLHAYCPRCADQHVKVSRERAPDTQTQLLVPLETCRHCNWLLFPSDICCAACGMPRGEQLSGTRGSSAWPVRDRTVRSKWGKKMLALLLFCAGGFGLVWLVIHSGW